MNNSVNQSRKHIVDGKIEYLNCLHPLNDIGKNNLINKTTYIKKFCKDVDLIDEINVFSRENYLYEKIENSKNENLFRVFLKNNKVLNISIEHTDDGGSALGKKKVSIPYHHRSFRKLILDLENVIVVNLYYALSRNEDNQIEVDYNNYVYIVIDAKDIYSSKGAADILGETDAAANSSSRWVDPCEILDILKKGYGAKMITSKKHRYSPSGKNVWIVHPKSIKHFVYEVIINEYDNQIVNALKSMYENLFLNNKNNKQIENEILAARREARRKMFDSLGDAAKCQIIGCNINDPNMLITSHIWAVNEIKEFSKLSGSYSKNIKANIKHISSLDNVFCLCPTHDRLFDRHWISFDTQGHLILTKKLDLQSLRDYNIDNSNKKIIKLKESNIFYLQKILWRQKKI